MLNAFILREPARRSARVMSRLVLAAMVLLATGATIFAFLVLTDSQLLARQLPQFPISAEGTGVTARLLIVLVNGVTIALTLYGLSLLHRAFLAIERGCAFEFQTGVAVRDAGRVFLLACGYAIVARVATSVLMTLGNPPGERMLALSLSTSDLLGLIFAGALLCLGQALVQASDIAEENRSFV